MLQRYCTTSTFPYRAATCSAVSPDWRTGKKKEGGREEEVEDKERLMRDGERMEDRRTGTHR